MWNFTEEEQLKYNTFRQLISFLEALSGKLPELNVIKCYFIYESVRNSNSYNWSSKKKEQLKYMIVICCWWKDWRQYIGKNCREINIHMHDQN